VLYSAGLYSRLEASGGDASQAIDDSHAITRFVSLCQRHSELTLTVTQTPTTVTVDPYTRYSCTTFVQTCRPIQTHAHTKYVKSSGPRFSLVPTKHDADTATYQLTTYVTPLVFEYYVSALLRR